MYLERYYEEIKDHIAFNKSKIEDYSSDSDKIISKIIEEYGEVAKSALTLDKEMQNAFITAYRRGYELHECLNFALDTVIFDRYGVAMFKHDTKFGIIIHSNADQMVEKLLNCNMYSVKKEDLLHISSIPARFIQVECSNYELLIYFNFVNIGGNNFLKLVAYHLSNKGDKRCFNFDVYIDDMDLFRHKYGNINPIVDVKGRIFKISLMFLLSFGVNFYDNEICRA